MRKMYAVVYPAKASPKKIGPPVAAEPALCVVTKEGELFTCGDEFGVAVDGARGSVSKDSARRHEARMSEKEVAIRGS